MKNEQINYDYSYLRNNMFYTWCYLWNIINNSIRPEKNYEHKWTGKMNKQKQIDWLYDRLCEYESGNRLKDMTFLDNLKKDKEYVEKHFDLSLIRGTKR